MKRKKKEWEQLIRKEELHRSEESRSVWRTIRRNCHKAGNRKKNTLPTCQIPSSPHIIFTTITIITSIFV